MKDKLHFWSEKFPLALAMAAQALVVTRWYLASLGNTMMPLVVIDVVTWATVVIAVAAGVALDLVVVSTVMARRDGRRSLWGVATAGAAAIGSAMIALDVYGGWTAGPWLHTVYPAVVFLFAMHLASPRTVPEVARVRTQRRALIVRLVRELRDLRARLARAEVRQHAPSVQLARVDVLPEPVEVQPACACGRSLSATEVQRRYKRCKACRKTRP